MDVISLALARKALDPKANVYEFKGSCAFEDLPEEAFPGEVWNITDDFDLDGKHYEAGTNVAYTNDGWDALTASIDTSIFELNANKVTSLSDQSTNEQYPSAKAVFDMIKSGEYKVYPHHRFAYYADEDKKGVYVFYNAMQVGMFGYRLKNTDASKYIYALPLIFFVFEDVDVNNPPQKDTVVASLYSITNMQKLTAFSFTYKTNGTLTVNEGHDFGTSSPANWLRFLNTSAQTLDGVKTFSSLPVSTPVPTQDGQLTNKKYVDDAIANIDISTATSAQIQALFGTEGGE